MAARARLIAPALMVGLVLVGIVFVTRKDGGISEPTALFPTGEMRIGVDATFPPFAVADGDALQGIDIDLANAISTRLGVPVRFVNLGYDGLYDALKADRVDLLISALLVDHSTEDDAHYTRSYFDAGLVLVSSSGSGLESMRDIPGHALAYEFGSSADAEAQAWLRRVHPFATQPYELPEYALDAVRLGAADAGLVDAISAYLYLSEHADWAAETVYVTQALYAIATRRDRLDIWQAVNDTLQAMIDDGAINAILDKWL